LFLGNDLLFTFNDAVILSHCLWSQRQWARIFGIEDAPFSNFPGMD